MRTIIVKQKNGKKWEPVEFQLNEGWQDRLRAMKGIAVEYTRDGLVTYASDMPPVRTSWIDNKGNVMVRELDDFCDDPDDEYLHNALAIFSEARTERIAICTAESVPPAEIARVLEAHPELYGEELTR